MIIYVMIGIILFANKTTMQCDREEKQLQRKTKDGVIRLVSAVFSQEGSWLGCC